MTRRNYSTSFLTAFAAAALLTGCGTIGGVLGGDRDRGPYDNDGRYDNGSSEQSIDNVRGTVERVNTAERYIVVEGEGVDYRSNLRNGDDELVLYYDERTVVEHQGQTYRPQDLENGDRIVAEVEQSGSRLYVEDIEVLYDVTSNSGTQGGSGSSGSYDDRDDDVRLSEVRGTVRSIDTRDRTLEIERSRSGSNNFSTGSTNDSYRSGDLVEIHYDAQTVVEYQGRRYAAENLERGDLVEVEVRTMTGGRLHAEEILVLADAQASGR
jgi:hypothetical protein